MHSLGKLGNSLTVGLMLATTTVASAASIGDYVLQSSFGIASANGAKYDVLPDGRIVTMNGAEVLVESSVGSRVFNSLGVVPNADFSGGGAGFLSVSPDGTKLAVGNNGGATFLNYELGIVPLNNLSGVTWFQADSFDAVWFDNTQLAVNAGATSPTNIYLLDTSSPNPASPNTTLILNNVGGASAGLTFDSAGNLYTGNGFKFGGPSETGAIKYFSAADVTAAINGTVIDFENTGTLVADILSASSLGFDDMGNFFIGGANAFSPPTEFGFAALVDSNALADAINGFGPVNSGNPAEVRKLDPEGNSSQSYDLKFNDVTGELYLRDGGTVYVYVPEPSSLILTALVLLAVRRR